MYEITCKTIDDRMLLRPSDEVNDIILGVLGRALVHYPVLLHAFIVMSNHLQCLVTPPDGQVLADFMCFVKSNIAREVGRIHKWTSRFWARRYSCIKVADEASEVGRLGYIMAHGAKEGLVWAPEQWPGAKSLPALLTGETLRGTWVDRTAACRAGVAKDDKAGLQRFKTTYEVPISPLPCWAELPTDEHQERCHRLRDATHEEALAEIRRTGHQPMGPRRIKKVHPHSRPRATKKKTPAPACHASTAAVRRRHKLEYRAFLTAYRQASLALRAGDLSVGFPLHCFPPPRKFVLSDAAQAP